MSVFAGLSAALRTQGIGKNAYRMRNVSRASFSPTARPRRGETMPERLEVLTDLLELPREAEVDHRDAGDYQEDEARYRRREAVVDAAATLSAGEREAYRVRDQDVRRAGRL